MCQAVQDSAETVIWVRKPCLQVVVCYVLLFEKGREIKGQILHNLGELMMWHAIQDCAETYLSEKHVYR